MVENASSQGKSRRAMASRLGTDDNAPSKNASEKFQKLVDEAMRDGYLSNAEAHLLVEQHNKMQHESREALRLFLQNEGYKNISRRGLHNNYMIHEVGSNDAIARTPSPMEDWLDSRPKDIDYVDYGKLVPSGKKTRFILITAGPAILALLRILGVF